MKRFARYISLAMMILICGIMAGEARADVFSAVPASSVLYAQLAVLQNATWENDISGKNPRLSKSAEQTRYEFAIEIAKSAIDFNAHRQANPGWLSTVPRAELRALRALVREFSVELAGFNVDTKDITDSIDGVLRSPESAPAATESLNLKAHTEKDHSLSLGSFPLSSSLSLTKSLAPQVLNVPLSKQFAFYAQLSTPSNALLRAVFPTTSTPDSYSLETNANTALSAGANMSINDWLSLRAMYAYNQNNQPQTLQQTLLTDNNSWFSALGDTDSIGGGLDVKLSPGLMLSGGISRLSLNAANGQNEFSGTQLEGGVGIRGLDNRLLLSARLARLMPDDAASLASTAARLNLDFALSNSLSLNLLYQQMFSLSPQQDGKSTFAGGVNIHF